jgi:hypothetical protein
MALHSGFVFRPAFLQRLAAASDLQKLFPAAAANSSMPPRAYARGRHKSAGTTQSTE